MREKRKTLSNTTKNSNRSRLRKVRSSLLRIYTIDAQLSEDVNGYTHREFPFAMGIPQQ